MNFVWKNIAFVILVATLSLGCAHTHGKPISGDLTSHIKSGVTKKSSVLEMFGEPYYKNIIPGGKEVWQYQYTRSKITPGAKFLIPIVGPAFFSDDVKKSVNSQALTITFDGDIVSSCTYTTSAKKGTGVVVAISGTGTTTVTKCGDEG